MNKVLCNFTYMDSGGEWTMDQPLRSSWLSGPFKIWIQGLSSESGFGPGIFVEFFVDTGSGFFTGSNCTESAI